MPDTKNSHAAPPWWSEAYGGIIGLTPEPWDADNPMGWPTAGYDNPVAGYPDWDDPHRFIDSGHTREEWLALADEMIQRWTAWRAHVAALPDSPPPTPDP